jgi:hypothetical protein
MNNHTRIKTLLVTTALLSPLLSHAITESEGLNACAQSLAEKIEIEQNAPLSFRVEDKNPMSSRKIREDMYFDLYVIDAKNDTMVLRANCFVSRSGYVRRLSTTPLVANNEN